MSRRGSRTARSGPSRYIALSQPMTGSVSGSDARSGCCSARSPRTSASSTTTSAVGIGSAATAPSSVLHDVHWLRGPLERRRELVDGPARTTIEHGLVRVRPQSELRPVERDAAGCGDARRGRCTGTRRSGRPTRCVPKPSSCAAGGGLPASAARLGGVVEHDLGHVGLRRSATARSCGCRSDAARRPTSRASPSRRPSTRRSSSGRRSPTNAAFDTTCSKSPPVSRMARAAWRLTDHVPRRLTATTSSNSSGLMFMSVRSRTMPALFTTASMPPNESTHACTSASCEVIVCDRSDDVDRGLPPAEEISPTTSREQLLVRAVDDDLRALGGQRHRERPAETSRRSGDDDALAVDFAHDGRA